MVEGGRRMLLMIKFDWRDDDRQDGEVGRGGKGGRFQNGRFFC